MSSPLRTVTPLFDEHENNRSISPANLLPLRSMITTTNINEVTAIERSRERERGPLDYTDLEGKLKYDE